MEAKEYVRRDRTMFVHIFRSVLDRDELIGRRLRSLAEMLCDGSLTPLLTHLARAKDLTDDDRLALRAIVEEPDTDALDINHGNNSVVSSPGNSPQTSRSRSSSNGRGNAGR
jgi:BlaI family transcriptional regulator, penicillinase repressor